MQEDLNILHLTLILLLKHFIGNFEFQFITGRLESSGFKPPGHDRTYGGYKLYIPKINQIGN